MKPSLIPTRTLTLIPASLAAFVFLATGSAQAQGPVGPDELYDDSVMTTVVIENDDLARVVRRARRTARRFGRVLSDDRRPGPPADRVERCGTPPHRHAVWVDGRWTWRHNRYAWIPGRWTRPRAANAEVELLGMRWVLTGNPRQPTRPTYRYY